MSPDVSVVIPIHNESPNIQELYRELTDTLEGWGGTYELLIVDDGSTDDSFEQLARLQEGDGRLRVIRFRRNFGQTAAFSAGFAHARGRWVVTADGDLQNDPAEIPRMLQQAAQGYDIVCGWRKTRHDASVDAAAALNRRQLAHFVGHGRAAARLRVLAQGVQVRGRETPEALRGNAPFHSGAWRVRWACQSPRCR